MRWRWTLSAGIAIALVLGGTVSARAGDPPALATGIAASGDVEPGIPLRWSSGAAAGDYVTGRLDVVGGAVDLDLETADGRHLRRLAENVTGKSEFRYVEGDRHGLLRLNARRAGSYRLEIVGRLPLAEQHTPQAVHLSPAITTLAAEIAAGGGTDAFWDRAASTGTPLVEMAADGRRIVTFLGRGARRNVRLFGAPSGDHEDLERLGGSDVWFRSFVVPADTRLSYQLAFDVPDLPGTARAQRVAILATAKADPLNRHPWPADAADAYNQDSVLELDAAPAQPFIADRQHPRGSTTMFEIESARLGNRRAITLYRPAGFDPSDPRTILLFVFDADQYTTKVPLPLILDNMIAQGALPPVVAVLVANPDRDARARELPGNADFADFMADDLLPRILEETGIRHRLDRTVLAGSSYGGLAAATIAIRHPDRFGNVLSMSGSFWWSPPGTPADRQEHVAGLVARSAPLRLRFFLAAGLFESGMHNGTAGILETNRHLRDVLVARSVPVISREYAGGHDYLAWRGVISDGLMALFPR